MSFRALPVIVVLVGISCVACQTEDVRARDYMDGYNTRAESLSNRYSLASWDYYTNITLHNQHVMVCINPPLYFDMFTL